MEQSIGKRNRIENTRVHKKEGLEEEEEEEERKKEKKQQPIYICV